MRLVKFAALVPGLVLLPAACASTSAPGGGPPDGLLLKRAEIMARPPDTDLGPVRIWRVEKTPDVTAFLIELAGVLPLHTHPDGVHRMYVIEGGIQVTVGTQTRVLGPGDYIMIPRNVPHRLERVGEGKAVYASVDSPPIDPANIRWIEPAPKRQ